MPAETAPSGRKVLVTGATGGIGRAIVEALAARDCAVAACDVTGAPLGELSDAATRVEFDVRAEAAVRAGVERAIEALDGCDAVVANAGVVDTIHRAERFADEEWRKDIETNLYGAFYVVRAAFEALAQSGDGRVVLISSAAAEIGVPGQVAYGASKAGLVGMARTLAAEWAPRGIRCNVVMPGFIATPKVIAMPEQIKRVVTASIPLARLGAAEELAGTVSFLLSPAAAYINGAVVRVDGGLGLSVAALATSNG
jgi:NAD(P)-dependent dehydrogenase (short-subunit alcohol dehydrogenase family)